MTKEVLSSVNLIPSDRDIEVISPVIEDLAEKYSSVSFLPHITIWGNIVAPLSVVEKAARPVIEGIKPFIVEVEGLGYSERWSKTLFAQIKPNEMLDEIHRRLGERLRVYSDFNLNPHLSLIYKRGMTEEEKLRETTRILIPDHINLDRIAITVPGDPIAKWENLSAWRTPIQISL